MKFFRVLTASTTLLVLLAIFGVKMQVNSPTISPEVERFCRRGAGRLSGVFFCAPLVVGVVPAPIPYNSTTSMPAFLDQIVGSKRAKVAATKREADLRDLEHRAEQHAPRGFRRALHGHSKSGIAVIAELKKASPSKGLIRPQFCVEQLAKELEKAGSATLSVLTDEEFFQGSLENLRIASGAVKLPCLRKDFIIDEYQVLEARANSADAVLLIVAALTNTELNRLALAAGLHGLDVLCEVHDEDELQRALDAGFDLIGVNTRDLRTFSVDPETAFRLAAKIPKSVLAVAESGIRSGKEVGKLRAAGYQAFLIGESLMRAESPGNALQSLLAEVRSSEDREPTGDFVRLN